ncbi:MAG: hypothetical protein Q9196_000694 [Gyalolechia fulgens]
MFFRIPAQEKRSIAHPGGSEPQRGFSKIGAENSSTLYRKGLLGAPATEELSDARVREITAGGVGSSNNDDRNISTKERKPIANTLLGGRVAARLMSALELALQLPDGTFLERITHEKNASELRQNHYPAIEVEEIKRGAISRIWPHFDLGVLTLLFQDNVGGLEFEDREKAGKFNRVQCGKPAEMVVNVSETLQRWTNGTLRAGLHRVSLPEDSESKESGTVPERYSVAYFCKADRAASVGPLKEFVGEGNAPKYDDISAIDYHLLRLQSAY